MTQAELHDAMDAQGGQDLQSIFKEMDADEAAGDGDATPFDAVREQEIDENGARPSEEGEGCQENPGQQKKKTTPKSAQRTRS